VYGVHVALARYVVGSAARKIVDVARDDIAVQNHRGEVIDAAAAGAADAAASGNRLCWRTTYCY